MYFSLRLLTISYVICEVHLSEYYLSLFLFIPSLESSLLSDIDISVLDYFSAIESIFFLLISYYFGSSALLPLFRFSLPSLFILLSISEISFFSVKASEPLPGLNYYWRSLGTYLGLLEAYLGLRSVCWILCLKLSFSSSETIVKSQFDSIYEFLHLSS